MTGYVVEFPTPNHVHDSGTTTACWGGGGADREHTWLQGYDSGFGDVITALETAYGSNECIGAPVPDGLPVQLGIWDDPDNDFDPTNAVLLWQTSVLSENGNTGLLNSYEVPGVAVSGVFFVGAVASHNGSFFPGPMDQSQASNGRAWLAADTTAAPFDMSTLTNNSFGPIDMDVNGFPTVWMIRARGILGQDAVFNEANGNYYRTIPGNRPWDEARALAEATEHLGSRGHLASLSSAAENDFVWNLVVGGATRYWLGAFQDTQSPLYSEPNGGWSWSKGEPLSYTNWTPGEPNDFGAGEGKMGFDLTPQWNDLGNGSLATQGLVIEYSTGSGLIGQPYCDPVGGNSVSTTGAQLGSLGGFGGFETEVLIANLPSQPGILFAGPNQSDLPFGCGRRCVAGNVVRYAPVFAAGGVVQVTVDMSSPGLDNLQFWYRDPANASACGDVFNLTNALELP